MAEWKKLSPATLVALFGGIGTIVGAILGVSTLIDRLDGDSAKATALQGSITVGRWQASTLEQFLDGGTEESRVYQDGNTFTEKQLATEGLVVSFDLTIEGYQEPCVVDWRIFDSETDEDVTGDVNQLEAMSLSYKADAAKEAFQSSYWVPAPEAAGTYYVRLYFYAPNGKTLLDSDDSEEFVVE